jgi:uncharacterized protein
MAGKNDDGHQGHAQDPGQNQPRRGRGFAGMDAERQRQISAEGGRAAHQKGTAHEFDSEEAREAGRKGGQASGGSRRRRSTSGTGSPATTESAASSSGGDESSESANEEPSGGETND